LRYNGSPNTWGFACHLASKDGCDLVRPELEAHCDEPPCRQATSPTTAPPGAASPSRSTHTTFRSEAEGVAIPCSTDSATAMASPSPSATIPPARRNGTPWSAGCSAISARTGPGDHSSYETILNHLCTTTTTTGLKVKAYLVTTDYPTGIKTSDEDMALRQIAPHDTQPARNYTLSPRSRRPSNNPKLLLRQH
jgi:Rhodopirellula transposase DDE domain